MTTVVIRTPLRVSFFGGGTDLPHVYEVCGGRILAAALAYYTYVLLDDRHPAGVHLEWQNDTEDVLDIAALQHGITREALLPFRCRRPVTIRINSPVRADGSGLAASASIAVGLIHAGSELLAQPLSTVEIADRACRIEMDRLQRPVGKQDPYLVALGGIRLLAINQKGTVTVQTPSLKPTTAHELERRSLLFCLGVRRDPDRPLTEMQHQPRARVAEWQRMGQLATLGAEALARHDWRAFGELVQEAWLRKRELAPTASSPAIDDAVAALRRAGADGVKLLGAGGGGWILAFTRDPEQRESLRHALRNVPVLPFRVASRGTTLLERTEDPQPAEAFDRSIGAEAAAVVR